MRIFKEIKILHLIKSLGRGGAEMLLPETLKVHNRIRFEFTYVYFLPHKNQLVSELEVLGPSVHCFNVSFPHEILLQAKKVAHFAKSIDADIIHAHLPLSGITARIAGRIANIPVVYTEHNLQEHYHPLTRIANIYTLPMCAHILGVSEDVTQSINRHLKKPVQVSALLNGVNTCRLNASLFDRMEIRRQLDIPDDAPVIGTVAVFRDQKKLDDWLHLAHTIWLKVPQVQFFILGDGPNEVKLKKQAENLGFIDHVHFPGRLSEVRPWLAAMDIYVMTSAYEGLPVALLEAMSMELPVVVTDVGGIPEVVRNEIEGYLIPFGSLSMHEEAILKLISDSSLRRRMGKAARERIVDSFSIHKMVKELELLYEQVIVNNKSK